MAFCVVVSCVRLVVFFVFAVFVMFVFFVAFVVFGVVFVFVMFVVCVGFGVSVADPLLIEANAGPCGLDVDSLPLIV